MKPSLSQSCKRQDPRPRTLCEMVGVSFTYVSKIENETLGFGDCPSDSEELIRKLADALDGDQDELLILAQKIPERSRPVPSPDR